MKRIRAPIDIEYARVDADRITVGERYIELPVAMEDEATIDVGRGKGRIDLDGSIEIGNRSIMVAHFIPN
jgi:hypothetical protein